MFLPQSLVNLSDCLGKWSRRDYESSSMFVAIISSFLSFVFALITGCTATLLSTKWILCRYFKNCVFTSWIWWKTSAFLFCACFYNSICCERIACEFKYETIPERILVSSPSPLFPPSSTVMVWSLYPCGTTRSFKIIHRISYLQ